MKTYEKTITYDHGDYRAELDGKLIGYYPNHHSAEVALDELIFDALIYGVVYEPPVDIPDEPYPPTPGGPLPPEYRREAA